MNYALFVYGAVFFIGISYGAHAPLVPVFAREELNATYTEIGIIGLANYIPYMFTPAIVGILLDRFNRGSIMSIGIAMSGISIFILSLSTNVFDVILIRALAGIAHAFFWPAASAIIASSATDNRVKLLSRYTMFWVAGYMIGPLLGAFLFQHFGFRLLFQYSSLITIASLIMAILIVRNNKKEKSAAYPLNILQVIKSNSWLYMLIIYYSASFGIILAVFPVYLKENYIDEFYIGILFFIFGIARLLILPFTYRFASREYASIIIATLSIALAMLITYSLREIEFFSLSLIMFGFSFSLYFPITLNMATRNIPVNMLGRYVGAYETIFGVGWALGPIAAGIAADLFINNIPYISMFIIGATLLMVRVMKDRKS